MMLRIGRRELLAGALASTAIVPSARSYSYGYYAANRAMRPPALQDGEAIWQWLVLLIDASSSMRERFERMTFYDLQIEATARALMEPCVADRLIGSRRARTAIGAILWSARMQQEVAVHWQVMRATDDIAAVARRLRNTANYLDSYTGVAAAIGFATGQLTAVHIGSASRKIIDVSANGRDNQGGDPAAAAARAEQAGITINAVVMEGYDGTVDEISEYYSDHVITRDGMMFKVPSESAGLEALATACTSKLCAEIARAPDQLRTPADLL